MATAEDRYALEVSAFSGGVQVIGGRTLIVPEKQAEMSLTDGEAPPQIPDMSLRRGGFARIEVGKQDASDAWIDGYVISLAPVAVRP